MEEESRRGYKYPLRNRASTWASTLLGLVTIPNHKANRQASFSVGVSFLPSRLKETQVTRRRGEVGWKKEVEKILQETYACSPFLYRCCRSYWQ
jgi:hypothetical protein